MDEFPLDETVTIFSNEDADLKLLGELLSNESSRAILMLLSEQEMTASELARTIGISLSVTLHHLDKMCKIDIVKVSKVTKNTKDHDMKYYAAKKGILILGSDSVIRAKESKTFAKSLRKVLSFLLIGAAGFIAWVTSKALSGTMVGQIIGGGKVPVQDSEPILAALVVVIVGLVLERIMVYQKKKR